MFEDPNRAAATRHVGRLSLRLGAVGLGLAVLLAAAPHPETGVAVVASDHILASSAGAEMLALGGNAVDAAVAAALASGVVQGAGSGLGGGGFAVGKTEESSFVLDFREVAPGGADADMYRTEGGGVDSQASRSGGLAVAVPGEPRGLAKLVHEYGSLNLRQVAGPAIQLASRGFEVGAHLSGAIGRTQSAGVKTLFMTSEGLATTGDKVRRPKLGRTLQRWASSGGEDLYTGAGARAMLEEVAATGGILSAQDLADYAPRTREPLVGTWGEYTLLTMPPPSSGGVVLLQMLKVLEGYDLASLGHNSADYIHILAEVMGHAYADRAHHLGDPDFVEVPVQRLLSDQRVDEIRHKVWPGRTFPAEHYGELIEPDHDAGTLHISVVDERGQACALTSTINTSFGSGVVVPSTGVILNNEMDDFAAAPGVPNAYGLVGNAANAIAPGKRPLSSMTPTVVLDAEGNTVMSIGASGGSFIISSTLQVMLNMLVFDMDAQAAVSAPRVHHQWQPHTLFVEPGVPDDVLRSLRARGHTVEVREGFSACQVVHHSGEGLLEGGSDPRKGGWPVGIRRRR